MVLIRLSPGILHQNQPIQREMFFNPVKLKYIFNIIRVHANVNGHKKMKSYSITNHNSRSLEEMLHLYFHISTRL